MQWPIANTCASGAKYFVPVFDDASWLSMVRTVRNKSEIPAVVKEKIHQMETMSDRSVKTFRSDNAAELLSKKVREVDQRKRNNSKTIPPCSSESNGKAERVQQTKMTFARFLLDMTKNVPKHKI